jgi:Transposase DNA-binding/Transposase DDE domain
MITHSTRPRRVSNFGDLRLAHRFTKIVNDLSQDIGKSISYCVLKCSQIKASYRFMSNKKVSHHEIMAIEQEQLVTKLIEKDKAASLIGSKRVVLHIQDTTTLNFSHQKSARQLPCLNYANHRGYFVHTSLVTDDGGCIENILDQPIWGRSEADLGTSKALQSGQKSLPIECKESERWVSQFNLFQSIVGELGHTRGISISDSESDIYELFIAKRANNVDLIARSHHNRELMSDSGKALKLETYLSSLPIQGQCWLDVLSEDKHTYRAVNLAIRFGEISIKLPENLKWSSSIPRAARRLEAKMAAKKGLTLRVIEVTQINPEVGSKPIHWTLLTTLPVNDYWDALQVIQYYVLRWRIEIFHLVFKEGCAIQKLQLEKPHRIQNAIALYSIIAAKVTALRYLAQTQGQKPMTLTGFTHKQYSFLNQYLKTNYDIRLPTPQKADDIPTVEQFIQVINCLAGGHKGNKNKEVGIRQLWKGLAVAKIVLKAFDAFMALDST